MRKAPGNAERLILLGSVRNAMNETESDMRWTPHTESIKTKSSGRGKVRKTVST